MQSRFFDKILRSLEYKWLRCNGLIANVLEVVHSKTKTTKKKERKKKVWEESIMMK